MQISILAARRWKERFPDHELAAEFARARAAGAKTKRQIGRQCPVRYKPSFMQRGVYYLRSPAGAIFVVAPGEFIVDVFPLGEKQAVRA